jgi:hypothetical protein
MADHSADAHQPSAARPAAALLCMGRREQRYLLRTFALIRHGLPGQRLSAFAAEPHGGFRFHLELLEGGAACSSSPGPASGRPRKPGPPRSVRSPTTSNAARTSTSTSTGSRKERKNRRWQCRGIVRRVVLRSAFHQWKATTDALDCEAPTAAPPDAEMESKNITDTLSEVHQTTTETTTETASRSTDTMLVAPSTPKTYARATTAQTSPSTGSAHCSTTSSQKRPVAASTPGSTTSPHPSPSRSAKKKKKPTPTSPATKGLRGSSKQPG